MCRIVCFLSFFFTSLIQKHRLIAEFVSLDCIKYPKLNTSVCDSSHGDPGQSQQGRGQRRADLRVCGPGLVQGGDDAPHSAGSHAPHGCVGGAVPACPARGDSLRQDRLR